MRNKEFEDICEFLESIGRKDLESKMLSVKSLEDVKKILGMEEFYC